MGGPSVYRINQIIIQVLVGNGSLLSGDRRLCLLSDVRFIEVHVVGRIKLVRVSLGNFTGHVAAESESWSILIGRNAFATALMVQEGLIAEYPDLLRSRMILILRMNKPWRRPT